ncbi:MAG: hypothetical protein FIA92_02520 [Chloroflexi bacterium]|nr:hypothetical protein [Chloroflexota bacterium]
MTRRRTAGLLAVAVGPLGWCVALGTVVGGDPMLAIEVAGAAFVALWAAFVAKELVRSQRLSWALDRGAHETSMFDVRVRVTPALRTDAIVVGAMRPVIYVGADLLATLSDDEMRAVVHHEDHHRRTRAPIRAAALGAWLRLVGRSTRVRGALLDRLSDLEALADNDAIQRGSSPRSLARALLKGEASLQPVSFAYAAERRVGQLLDRAAGVPVQATDRLPYEWLPVALLTVATLGCHAGL